MDFVHCCTPNKYMPVKLFVKLAPATKKRNKMLLSFLFWLARLGPPILSLTGCGDCLQLAISLPEADNNSGIVDIQKFYSARFRILCKRGKDMVVNIFCQLYLFWGVGGGFKKYGCSFESCKTAVTIICGICAKVSFYWVGPTLCKIRLCLIEFLAHN